MSLYTFEALNAAAQYLAFIRYRSELHLCSAADFQEWATREHVLFSKNGVMF